MKVELVYTKPPAAAGQTLAARVAAPAAAAAAAPAAACVPSCLLLSLPQMRD